MILCGTGHRPDKLGGYTNEVSDKLMRFARTQLLMLKPEVVISGMALGWDTALAEAALDLDIPLHAFIPFEGQESRWPNQSQRIYRETLMLASNIVYCSTPGYAVWKMQKRNEDMVNASDLVLALWNGSDGGTGNCIKYANKKGTEILNVWDEWLDYEQER